MSKITKCDRCGQTEKWDTLSGRMFEVSFASNILIQSTGLREYVNLCLECFEEFKKFINKEK